MEDAGRTTGRNLKKFWKKLKKGIDKAELM